MLYLYTKYWTWVLTIEYALIYFNIPFKLKVLYDENLNLELHEVGFTNRKRLRKFNVE